MFEKRKIITKILKSAAYTGTIILLLILVKEYSTRIGLFNNIEAQIKGNQFVKDSQIQDRLYPHLTQSLLSLRLHEIQEYINNIDFIEKQRSLITRKKIISISQRLMGMTLLVYPARDFDKFVSLQNETIISEFNGQRTRIREQKLFILELGGKLLSGFKVLRRKFQPELRMKDELELLIDIYAPRKDVNLFGGSIDFPNFEKVVFVNLKNDFRIKKLFSLIFLIFL